MVAEDGLTGEKGFSIMLCSLDDISSRLRWNDSSYRISDSSHIFKSGYLVLHRVSDDPRNFSNRPSCMIDINRTRGSSATLVDFDNHESRTYTLDYISDDIIHLHRSAGYITDFFIANATKYDGFISNTPRFSILQVAACISDYNKYPFTEVSDRFVIRTEVTSLDSDTWNDTLLSINEAVKRSEEEARTRKLEKAKQEAAIAEENKKKAMLQLERMSRARTIAAEKKREAEEAARAEAERIKREAEEAARIESERKKREAEEAFWNSPEGMKVRAAQMIADTERQKAIDAANIRIAEQERIAAIGRQIRQEERENQDDLIRKVRDL